MRRADMTIPSFACEMTALSSEERESHSRTTRTLFSALLGVQEQPDGFSFRFPAEAGLLGSAASFIALERLCCPFFGFALELDSGAATFRLRIAGSPGVKPFIREEFADAFSAAGQSPHTGSILPA